MSFLPAILNPTPDPSFVRELRKIDPDLRVTFGYSRYFVKQWAIERKMPPERYFEAYASLLESGDERVIRQPIFDTNQPLFDERGDQVGFRVVGERDFDLAPEYEWVMFSKTLDARVLTELRRAYAWDRNQPITRLKYEKAQEEARKQEEEKKRRMDACNAADVVEEFKRHHGIKVQFDPVSEIKEGTELD